MTTPAPTNGCHNRPAFKRATVVQDGWFIDGVTRIAKVISVPFRMSPDCNYTRTTLGQADARCHGCKWRHEEKV